MNKQRFTPAESRYIDAVKRELDHFDVQAPGQARALAALATRVGTPRNVALLALRKAYSVDLGDVWPSK